MTMMLAAISRACEKIDYSTLHNCIEAGAYRTSSDLYCYYCPSLWKPANAETQALGLKQPHASGSNTVVLAIYKLEAQASFYLYMCLSSFRSLSINNH